jgi:hypothetical protein
MALLQRCDERDTLGLVLELNVPFRIREEIFAHYGSLRINHDPSNRAVMSRTQSFHFDS